MPARPLLLLLLLPFLSASGRQITNASDHHGGEAFGKIRAVNLGGWLVIEKWIKPSLFDGIPNKDLLDGTQIQLRSLKLGLFVSADGGGGQKISVNRPSASEWETFKLWRVTSTRFQLRVSNNDFVSASDEGAVEASKSSPDMWETFEIIRDPSSSKRVHLRAHSGMYLQAKDPSQLTADYKGTPGWDNNPAVFEMFVNTLLGGEFQLANGYGLAAAPAIFEQHRNGLVTANDFKFLASNGINAVRIPVGWWIAYDPKPPFPFVGGSLQALDNAFQWAGMNNMKVIIDLHGAPGSQNPWEHSGTRDGVSIWSQPKYISQTIQVIDFLASRYSKNPALLGIELLNEPRSDDVSFETLKQYYTLGYQTVRKHTSTAYVIMCQRIGADPNELANLLTKENGYSNVALDIHLYNLFYVTFYGKSVQWNIDYVYNERKQQLDSLRVTGGPAIFVGEWTNELNVTGASSSDYTAYATAQLEVFGAGASLGWSFWCLKNDNLHWDFERSVKMGYLRRKGSRGGWP
ncbi:glucan 1,3-beta-glucosidase A [Selaginella moellendorffii]|uniref:glucan 1,3-beta-glucosidase A n=1 Tax=Selaginella moellendorffii TaxID=88036 RepID=UPI000D1CBEC3|nr:glucan 1,3-beta-glucosidase A [Selaginella moellendorffii]|eukprot:XP_024519973.1 glucan 1,3-beta-glucosidase A [Selaginella moellendorffii]